MKKIRIPVPPSYTKRWGEIITKMHEDAAKARKAALEKVINMPRLRPPLRRGRGRYGPVEKRMAATAREALVKAFRAKPASMSKREFCRRYFKLASGDTKGIKNAVGKLDYALKSMPD